MSGGADRPTPHPLVRVMMQWSAQAFETEGVTPPGSVSAVILWEGFTDVDGGVPDRLVRPLALALTEVGEVCFRTAEQPPATARVLATAKTGFGPFARRWAVVGVRDADAATTLFDAGWAQGDQLAMVAPADDQRATAMLTAARPGEIALTDVELVVAPIVDGAGMLVAAADRARLDEVLGRILQHCTDSGIAQGEK